MAVKISGMMGTGSMGHNNRKFITENVDPARTEQNITLRRENLKQVYDTAWNVFADETKIVIRFSDWNTADASSMEF